MSVCLNEVIMQMNVFLWSVYTFFVILGKYDFLFQRKSHNLFWTLSACRFVSFFCIDTQRHSCTIFLSALVINIVPHFEFKCFRSLTFSVNRNIPQVEVKGTWKFPGSRSVFNLFVGFVPEYFPLFQKSKTKQIENQFEESLNNQETTMCCLSWTPVSSLGTFREMRSSIYSCNIDKLPLVIRFQQILAF